MPWIPPSLTKQQLEQRRIEALKILSDSSNKLSQIQIAAQIGVTPAAISNWKKRSEHGRLGAMKITGRPKRLDISQLEQIKAMILESPKEYGYQRLGWTTTLVADLIKQKFKISYHPDHVGKILHQLELSVQKPKVRGIKRDEVAIQKWIQETYPELKKNGRKKATK